MAAAALGAFGMLAVVSRRPQDHVAPIEHVPSFGALPAGGLLPTAEAMARIEDELALVEQYSRPLCLAMLGVEPLREDDPGDLIDGVARLLAGGLRRHDVLGVRGPAELLLMLPETEVAFGKAAVDRLRERAAGLAHLRVAMVTPTGRESLRELLIELDSGLAACRSMGIDFGDPARLLAR